MRKDGPRYSKAEALDILNECRLIQEAIDELTVLSNESLRVPDLRLVTTENTVINGNEE